MLEDETEEWVVPIVMDEMVADITRSKLNKLYSIFFHSNDGKGNYLNVKFAGSLLIDFLLKIKFSLQIYRITVETECIPSLLTIKYKICLIYSKIFIKFHNLKLQMLNFRSKVTEKFLQLSSIILSIRKSAYDMSEKIHYFDYII